MSPHSHLSPHIDRSVLIWIQILNSENIPFNWPPWIPRLAPYHVRPILLHQTFQTVAHSCALHRRQLSFLTTSSAVFRATYLCSFVSLRLHVVRSAAHMPPGRLCFQFISCFRSQTNSTPLSALYNHYYHRKNRNSFKYCFQNETTFKN